MRKPIPIVILIPALFALFSGGCADEETTAGPGDVNTSTGLTCIGCHESQDSLVANLPAEGRVVESRGDG